MLEATRKNEQSIKDTRSIRGDLRPGLSPTDNFSFSPGTPDSLGEFRLQSNSLPLLKQGPNLNSLNSLLTRDYEKLDKKPKNPVLLNKIGITYLQSGKISKALKFFKQAHDQNPTFLSAAQNLARAYVLSAKFNNAVEIYDEIICKITDNPTILHEYSLVKLIMGDLDAAVDLLSRIKTDFKEYYEVQNTLGLVFLAKNDKSEAKKYFKLSNHSNPNYTHALNNIGAIEQEEGHIDKAKTLFNKAIVLDPGYVAAHLNLVNAQITEGNFQLALKHISSIQHLVSINNEILFKFAWILMKLDRYIEAIKEYEKFLQIVPNNSSALNNLGHCYVRIGRTDQAISYFYNANRSNPTDPLPLYNLMVVLTDLGRNTKAKEIADQVLPIDPTSEAALYALGGYFIKKEMWDKAEESLGKAIQNNTSIESAYANLGFIYTDIRRNYDKAIKLMLARFKNGAKQFDIINNLAHAYLQANNVKAASPFVRLLPPKHPIGLATRGLYELKLGNKVAAQQLYGEAIKYAAPTQKSVFEQQYYYDLSRYYIDVGDLVQGKKELKKCLAVQGARQYIHDDADQLLGEL